MDPKAEAKVLVVRLTALGDVLFALPAVDALRRARPHWSFDWVVEDKAATLLELYPGLRRRLVYPRRDLWRDGRIRGLRRLGRHLRELRTDSYDLVLDFQGNLKSGLHSRLARTRRRVGYTQRSDQDPDRRLSREGNHRLMNERVDPPGDALHRIDQGMALARAVAPDLPSAPRAPALQIPQDSQAFADEALRASGFGDEDFTVLHPGTSAFGAFKRWEPARFAALATRLAADHGLRSLVTWGPGEEGLARAVTEACDDAIFAPPTRSLADLAAILQRARLMVGSDSAPMHLGAFLGTPVVALFGPKDARMYGPRFAPHRVVSTYVPCRPCRRRTCPDVLCMEEIRVEHVAEAAGQLLDVQSRTAP